MKLIALIILAALLYSLAAFAAGYVLNKDKPTNTIYEKNQKYLERRGLK